MELRYLRDTSRREVDFVVIRERQPLFAVECKVGDRDLAPQLKYFKERADIRHFYQVHLANKDYLTADGIRVLPFWKFTTELGLP